jgi:hypothetical protein
MRPTFFVIALCWLLISCSRKPQPPARTWYEVAPLLDSLRPEEHGQALLAAGTGSATDLPLYDLSLQLSPDLSQFRLKQALYFTNTFEEPLDEVVLRIYANAVGGEPSVRFEGGSCKQGPDCALSSPAPSVIAVKPATPLGRGERLLVELDLSGKLRQIDPSRTTLLAQGLESMARMGSDEGAGDYGLLAHSDGIASYANFYAMIARRIDGKWQRSESSSMGDLGAGSASHVRLRVEAPPDVRVVSSGVTTRESALEPTAAGPRRELLVVAALVRDFALLASRKFESSSRKLGPVEVRSHYLARDREAGGRVLDAAARSLEVYEKRFGRYPYVDLDIVEAPLVGGAGGVEFSGLVTVASMLYRPMLGGGPLGMLGQLLGGGGDAQVSALTDSMLEFVTAHEIAHQYWPGLVGSDSRMHPWADESLAQYSALVYFEDRYGAERATQEAERQVLANYQMMRVLGKADGRVDRPVDAFESELSYAGLVYGKGPFLFRELRKTVGDRAFFSALAAHVAEYRFKTAPPRALIERLAKGERADEVQALARRWLDESHGDDDLGAPDLKQILAGYLGQDVADNLGPELELATKLLLRLLRPEGGQGGAGGLLELFGGGAGGGGKQR